MSFFPKNTPSMILFLSLSVLLASAMYEKPREMIQTVGEITEGSRSEITESLPHQGSNPNNLRPSLNDYNPLIGKNAADSQDSKALRGKAIQKDFEDLRNDLHSWGKSSTYGSKPETMKLLARVTWDLNELVNSKSSQVTESEPGRMFDNLRSAYRSIWFLSRKRSSKELTSSISKTLKKALFSISRPEGKNGPEYFLIPNQYSATVGGIFRVMNFLIKNGFLKEEKARKWFRDEKTLTVMALHIKTLMGFPSSTLFWSPTKEEVTTHAVARKLSSCYSVFEEEDWREMLYHLVLSANDDIELQAYAYLPEIPEITQAAQAFRSNGFTKSLVRGEYVEGPTNTLVALTSLLNNQNFRVIAGRDDTVIKILMFVSQATTYIKSYSTTSSMRAWRSEIRRGLSGQKLDILKELLRLVQLSKQPISPNFRAASYDLIAALEKPEPKYSEDLKNWLDFPYIVTLFDRIRNDIGGSIKEFQVLQKPKGYLVQSP